MHLQSMVVYNENQDEVSKFCESFHSIVETEICRLLKYLCSGNEREYT